MDPSAEARDIAKKQFTNVRRSLDEFEERFIASRWDEDTIVRQGFDRFLGSLDRVAGWLFPEPDQPRQALEQAREPDTTEQIHDVPEQAEVPSATAHADEESRQNLDEPDTADQAQADEPATVEPVTATGTDTWEQATADEPDTAEQAQADEPDAAIQTQADEPGTAEQTPAGTVDVAFTLPADVEAISVALCGEFNGWSEDDILLSRDTDGTWQTTVALAPGSYRYRFLIDGKRWENARQADDYVPNPFGELDSVVIVSSPKS